MEWKRYLKTGSARATDTGEREPFDAGRLLAEIGRLADEAGAVQVAGGWDRVKIEQPERWRRLKVAFLAVDDAFSRRDAGGVMGAITVARRALVTV